MADKVSTGVTTFEAIAKAVASLRQSAPTVVVSTGVQKAGSPVFTTLSKDESPRSRTVKK
jgi:hypothetical protein